MGFVETNGLVRGDGPDLVVEFRRKFGFVYGKSKTVRVPLACIESMKLKRRWLGSAKLVVQANSLAVLAGLPESDLGRIEFHIARRDRPAAEKFVERSYESVA
jgi:hypothetical protein